jgi:PTH2 family peptidyl-tRNA hydrolase
VSHKQVIGKMIAQGAHASMAAILNEMREVFHDTLELQMDARTKPWLTGNFKKVCVYVESEEDLLWIYKQAKDAGLITALITDSGLTEFHGIPTNTCIAVGPDFEDKVDKITGHLKLL